MPHHSHLWLIVLVIAFAGCGGGGGGSGSSALPPGTILNLHGLEFAVDDSRVLSYNPAMFDVGVSHGLYGADRVYDDDAEAFVNVANDSFLSLDFTTSTVAGVPCVRVTVTRVRPSLPDDVRAYDLARERNTHDVYLLRRTGPGAFTASASGDEPVLFLPNTSGTVTGIPAQFLFVEGPTHNIETILVDPPAAEYGEVISRYTQAGAIDIATMPSNVEAGWDDDGSVRFITVTADDIELYVATVVAPMGGG